jgi:hypothetical protein
MIVLCCADVEAGNYKITLDWEMDGGAHPYVFAQPEVVTREVRAATGDRVLTVYGTGIVLGVRAEDGVHIVNVKQVSGDMTAYLSPEGILRKLPAIVGEYVCTILPSYLLLSSW